MNTVNKLDNGNINKKKSSSFGKLPYIFALSTILSLANPSEMKANEIINNDQQDVEVVTNSDIISNISSRTGFTLPGSYEHKLRSIISANRLMQDRGSAKYIEDFIVKEMQKDWGISKQNQLLFIWTHIYKEISGKFLYDGADGDDDRLDEYTYAIEYLEECGDSFRKGYIAYTKKRSADAQQRSADAQQRSADAQQRSAESNIEIIRTTNSRLNNLLKFYNLYKNNPNSIKQDEISYMMRNAKEIVQDCKKYNIDYRSKLPAEVRSFYGID